MSKEHEIVLNKVKDEQFKVHTLTENSSQSSTRKDRQYQISYDNDSEQQKNQKSQVKSLDQLPQQRQQKQKQFLMKQQYVDQLSTGKNLKLQNKFQLSGQKQQLRASDDLNYEGQLEKKRKKRKQIFENIKRYNKNRQKFNNLQQQNVGQKIKKKNMMNRVSFQKKKQNHSFIKIWNYQRIKNIEFHKKVLQQILKGIQKNIRSSLEHFQIYRAFFALKYEQQYEYSLQNAAEVANQQHSLEQNQVSQQIYLASSTMFNIMAKKQNIHKQLAAEFAQHIQTKILKQIFEQYFDNIHKQSILNSEKIKVIRQQLQKIDDILCKKLINLQKHFSQCCQDIDKQLGKDFYRVQLSFLRKCQSEMMLQSNYGRILLEFYQKTINQQKIRKLLIEKSLRIYNEGMKIYQKGIKGLSNSKSISRIIQLNNNKTKNDQNQISIEGDMEQIKRYYKIENMLSPETFKQLKKRIENIRQKNKNHSTIDLSIRQSNTQLTDSQNYLPEQIRDFILKCEVQEFSCHHLIIKKFNVEVFKQQKWIPGQVVITVDKYVHVFLNAIQNSGILVFGSRIFNKPELTLKIDLVEISFPSDNQNENQSDKNEDLKVIISVKKPEKGLKKIASLLKINKNMQESVRFSLQNDLIQFQDYIEQLSK